MKEKRNLRRFSIMKKAMKTTLKLVWNVITLPIRMNYIIVKACEEKEYGFNGNYSDDCLVA
jgi:hypothetical protein